MEFHAGVTAEDLWQTSPDALLVVEAGGVIRGANPAAHALFHYGAEELVGRSVEDLVPEAARERHHVQRREFENAPHARPMGTGQRLEGCTRDGDVFPIHVSLAPVGSGSKLTIAAVRDMTAWMDAEQSLATMRRRRDLAEDHERIARQLHDTVIQELFAAGMALQAIQAMSDSEPAVRIAGIVEGLDATSRTIRSVIFDLSSPIHSEHGLRSRATGLVGELADLLGFEPHCQFAGPLDTAVPDSLVEDALAVLREALTNVARHAGATTVDIRVEVADELSVEVIDNGSGLPAGSTRHSGLANLATRALQRQGRFNAYTAPTGGTALEWIVPVVADPEPEGS
ncbi:MAG: PAS domain S-box protein [Actinobacteria bacterium]|nr:PAS domain S-box protein [Actinomycetota bacterium]